MSYLDQIQVGSTTYDIRDSGAQRETIIGSGAPTSSTLGTVGLHYIDDTATAPPYEYVCSDISGGAYTWIPAGYGERGEIGPQGPQGDSGVYVGSAAPTDEDIRVWVDTSGTGFNLVDYVYPVGSVYISVSSTPPATLFGGTWEQIMNADEYLQKNLLWTNPNPTASFAAQKVSLGLSQYALVLILFRGVNQSVTGDDMSIVGTVGSNVYMNGTAYHTFKRNAQIDTDGVEFFNGYYNGGYGTADWRLFDTACIPTAIYGIKETSPFDGIYRWKRTA